MMQKTGDDAIKQAQTSLRGPPYKPVTHDKAGTRAMRMPAEVDDGW